MLKMKLLSLTLFISTCITGAYASSQSDELVKSPPRSANFRLQDWESEKEIKDILSSPNLTDVTVIIDEVYPSETSDEISKGTVIFKEIMEKLTLLPSLSSFSLLLPPDDINMPLNSLTQLTNLTYLRFKTSESPSDTTLLRDLIIINTGLTSLRLDVHSLPLESTGDLMGVIAHHTRITNLHLLSRINDGGIFQHLKNATSLTQISLEYEKSNQEDDEHQQNFISLTGTLPNSLQKLKLTVAHLDPESLIGNSEVKENFNNLTTLTQLDITSLKTSEEKPLYNWLEFFKFLELNYLKDFAISTRGANIPHGYKSKTMDGIASFIENHSHLRNLSLITFDPASIMRTEEPLSKYPTLVQALKENTTLISFDVQGILSPTLFKRRLKSNLTLLDILTTTK
ncbi:MAG: hypothetical protein J0H12_07340 [Candidatus Paracaedimonas acanthamoebae]|uniref:Uncharacterized protein n=1 Tax=Candidatus Paracaedimonas acanthamoebae TaxID=244581 RepID=A0A8J7PSC2_9PROT|nr:hypothetical protein [Candidatus Paracaedimonas acanthamoebae]